MGLGNPGKQYARTRHNVGFMVVEALAREGSGTWAADLLAGTCRIRIGDARVLLVEPLTFMNNSGIAVQSIVAETQLNPRDLLVIFDDLNLPFGRIRIREQGSAGVHHGLESIIELLQTDEILRMRMGIGEDLIPAEKSDFVLSDIPPEKQTDLNAMIIKAGDAVKSILSNGVSKTMAIFNA